MPKCNINDETCPGWRVEVSWRPNNDEHSPNTPGHVQVASVNQHSELVLDDKPFDGWRVTLDRAGGERMISALHKALDAAFPLPVSDEVKGCNACGNPDARILCDWGTQLTPEQWRKHAEHVYDEHREYGADRDTAWSRAVARTTEAYGPEPDAPGK